MGRDSHDFLQFFTSPSERQDELSDTFNLSGILAAIIGVSCLAYVVLMCVCRGSGHRKKTKDVEADQSSHKTNKAPVVAENGAETRTDVVRGRTLPGPDATSSHQANQMPANARASLARLLPAPPVSNVAAQNNQQLPSNNVVPSSSGLKHVSDTAAQNNVLPSSDGGTEMSNDDYEHLGPKSVITPSDYDSLNQLRSQERTVVASESPESSDNDYSELDDKPYPEVIEVSGKRKELSAPYSKVKDEVELKEEDPYNHIGDSDGTVSTQVIQQLKQSSHSHAGDSGGSVSAALIGRLKQLPEQDDPYATVQDGSGGTIRNVLKSGEVTQDTNPQNATGTSDHFAVSESLSKHKSEIVEEYAVVHKTKGKRKHKVGDRKQGSRDKNFNPCGVSPPEPPRLYTASDAGQDAKDTPKQKTNIYLQVTVRESLASISARTENPYESMPDTLENTYTLVEGSPVEEIEITPRAGGLGANRISEISDTYAEIGTSGGSVNYSNISSHLEHNKNIAASTTRASLLTPATQATKQHIHSNNSRPSQNSITPAGVAGNSSNLHEVIREYEDSDGTYVTLDEKSDVLSLSGTASQRIPRPSDRVTVQGQGSASKTVQQVKGYADYEDVDETREYLLHNKRELEDNKVGDGMEHKKVAQRRRLLDHK